MRMILFMFVVAMILVVGSKGLDAGKSICKTYEHRIDIAFGEQMTRHGNCLCSGGTNKVLKVFRTFGKNPDGTSRTNVFYVAGH